MPLRKVLRKCCFGMRSETLDFSNIQSVSKDNLVSHVAETDNFDWLKEKVYDNNVTIFRTVSNDDEPDFKFLDHLSSLPRKKRQNDYVESRVISCHNNAFVDNETAAEELGKGKSDLCILCSAEKNVTSSKEFIDSEGDNLSEKYCKACHECEVKSRRYIKTGVWDPSISPIPKNKIGTKSRGVYIVNPDDYTKAMTMSFDDSPVQLMKHLNEIPVTHRSIFLDCLDNQIDICERADDCGDLDASSGDLSARTSGYYQSIGSSNLLSEIRDAIANDSSKRESLKDHDYESLDSVTSEYVTGDEHDNAPNSLRQPDRVLNCSYTERSEQIISLGPLESVRGIQKSNLGPSLSLGTLEMPKHLRKRRPSFTPRRRSQSLVSETAIHVEKFGKRLYTQEWIGRISKWQKFYSEDCLAEIDDDYDEVVGYTDGKVTMVGIIGKLMDFSLVIGGGLL